MNDIELLSLLSDVESDLVERKASLSSPDRVREAICAFANDLPEHRKPGVIFIGANDDGSCANITVSDELLRLLADMRDDGAIQPFPSMEVRKRNLKDCEMAVVLVHPSMAPPVRFKGRTYIRVGPRRAIATAEEERRLAEAMKVLGYVQRFGVGIQIARQELKKNGNPGPEFLIEPTNIMVTVWKRR